MGHPAWPPAGVVLKTCLTTIAGVAGFILFLSVVAYR
jgi:hypothetical protein